MERRVITVLVQLLLLVGSICNADKLSPGQKAPAFAKGSGGQALKTPFEGGARAADVGHRRLENPAPPAAASGRSGGATQVDGVTREETEELKEVDGQLVRVVKGSFAYDSPEGLPISVKYVADENGNRASFMFGTGGGSRPSSGGGQGIKKPGLTPGGPGATSLGGRPGGGGNTGGGRPGGGGNTGGGRPGSGGNTGGGRPGGGGNGQGGASTYLPPTAKVDRSYLPPN